MNTVESPYLTAWEAIAYLRLPTTAKDKGKSALYALMREHRLPYLRCGRNYRFDRRELDAWLHGHDSALEWARAQRRTA